MLPLAAYRDAIALDEPFRPAAAPAPAGSLPHLVRAALHLLGRDPAVTESGLWPEEPRHLDLFDDTDARLLLRAVLTVRPPHPLPPRTARALDTLLGGERQARPVTDPSELPTLAEQYPQTTYPEAGRTVLWQGDITTLAADAIVNAANSALLGCFVPHHPCIDNAIHCAAGPRLRDDCHRITTLQDNPEPTGTAKITRGYHLPAPYVLHTVGPVVAGPLRSAHQRALAASYRACLDLAAETGTIRTVAFCSVSTGVFGYPKRQAARTALATVADWLDARPGRLHRVIFNVYGDEDRAAYLHALTDTEGTPAA
ncbi:protein-ADP-ribose hydrolase [Streptomyces sp. ISID311]|uniref:protein-ADP-ribose hydrolase n=1 Tax=Streptomyces sp. ISID311 TaxID=2601673 RepID=UPI0021C3B1E6|nr:protein-ADP-ribose hydrolase [Streptomyces sp. ISID311]